jgi:hypothetical protein
MQSISDFQFSIALNEGRYSHPLSLARHHAQVYSQNGEDGIIAEIFHRIGVEERTFIEIGVENGLQSNTRLLLEAGWRGIWMDMALAAAGKLFHEFVENGTLTLIESILTLENVNLLLDKHDIADKVDFLSIDIDQNTSHVWRALRRRARVSCIEYNASIPAPYAMEARYDPCRGWDGTNWYGGSLKALEKIGRAKGLSLVGCELNGVNAFFVDEREAIGRFKDPFTAESHWEPPRYDHRIHSGHLSALGQSFGPRKWDV